MSALSLLGRGPTEQAALPIDVNHAVKAQWIRVADVFVVGPVMTWGGVFAARRGSPFLGTLLAAMGVGTAIFNAWNWWTVHKALRQTSEGAASTGLLHAESASSN